MRDTDIQSWLSQLGLARYAQAFEANDIDAEVLPELDDHALRDIGVSSVGHRIRLLKAIAELRAAADVVQAARASPATAPTARPEGERRQITVLFCDIVGYTEMANRLDPEDLQQVVRRYEDECTACIARFDGDVFQRLGDGMVAFFGYPLAHEGEAERAVYAGLAILDALGKARIEPVGQIHVRIGIASGMVVISSLREGAIGETMNLASRLQALAAPDTIVVNAEVRRLARGVFDYADLGARTLKGIAEPAQVYRVLGVSKIASRFEAATQGGMTTLVGREHESSLLINQWLAAQDGAGRVLLVSGEAGIGKSRMASALRARVEAAGGQGLMLQASPYHVSSAYYPIIHGLERLLRFERDDTLDDRRDKLEVLLAGRYGLPLHDHRFVASLLSLASEHRYDRIDVTPQKYKDETLRVVLAMITADARRQPALLIVEDAHWCDPTTLEVLDRLVDASANLPPLIVLTHRPGFSPAWLHRDHVVSLPLSRLTPSQGRALVGNLARGKALPEELIEEILTRSDGVPLFLEEVTRNLLESGQLRESGERYVYAHEDRQIKVPATLRESLMARLDRSAPLREIAKVGAAIGREFSYELVAAVANGDRIGIDSALDQLTRSGLAFRRGKPPEATYVFKHALVQDVAYDSLLKVRRQELHARIARVIEERFPGSMQSTPELLARHLTAAGEAEAAVGYWLKAGRLALNRMAMRECIAHLDQGLKVLGGLPRDARRDGNELDLRTLLGTAWVALRGFASSEAGSNFHRALQLARSLDRQKDLLPVYFGLSSHAVLQGRLAEGLDWVKETQRAGRTSGDVELTIIGDRSACTTYFWLGEFQQSHDAGLRALQLYNDQHHRHLAEATNTDPRTVVELYQSLDSWILGHPDRAMAHSAAKDVQARRRGHAFDLGYALAFGAHLLDLRRQPEAMLARVEEAEHLGKAQSLPFISDVLAQIQRGIAWIRMGRVEDGIERLRLGMGRWEEAGGGMWLPYLRSAQAEGLAQSGDTEGALTLLEESLAQIGRPGWEERAHLAEVLRIKGEVLRGAGNASAAEEALGSAIEVARAQTARGWELRAATSLARLLADQGRVVDARQWLAPVSQWFTEGEAEADLVDARALLGRLS